MKIAINGSIVDTDLIWKIDPIQVGNAAVYFEIHFLQGKKLTVMARGGFPWFGHDKPENKEIMAKHVKEITEIYGKVVTLWMNGQSSIPQFNYDPGKSESYDGDD